MAVQTLSGVHRAVVGFAFVFCVSLGVGASAADQPTAVLVRVSGTPAIFELSAGKPRHTSYVAQGNRYELPIEIETGASDSATFALPNSVIEVSPNSLMRIVAPENQDVGVVQRVLQQAGSSLFRVHRGRLDRFQVETPFLVSVVKGTVFNVLVRADGATVSLQEGRLLVNSLDARQTVELAPGDVAFAGRDGALRMLKVEVTDAGGKTRETVATRSDGGANTGDVPVDVTQSVVQGAVPSVGSAVNATVSPVVASVAAPAANVVDPVVNNVVAPLVANVVAPVANTVVGGVVAPAVDTVIAPMVNTFVAPVANSVVAPIVAPVVAAVTPVVAPVVTPIVAPVVAPIVAPVVAPLAPIVAPLAPVLAPVTNLLGFRH
jgi:hypothetical protein